MPRVLAKSAVLQPPLFEEWDEPRLLAACMALGANSVGGWTVTERQITRALPPIGAHLVDELASGIRSGDDPLGSLFSRLRSAAQRRGLGATYTPLLIVRAMIAAQRGIGTPGRVVDPGCGSARFLVEAGRTFSSAELVGFEVDPVASVLARAHLAAAGFAERSQVTLANYLTIPLPHHSGRTLFIGNPPYVRHHLLPTEWKDWLVDKAADLGCRASQLAGLHVYFFLATVLKGRPGDFGSFITAAEWLDVNYGSVLRQLFVRQLGGTSLTVVEPTVMPFPDAATTGVVTTFELGAKPESVALTRIEKSESIARPEVIRRVRRERLEAEQRWSHLTRGARNLPSDLIELGELCRVHRGAVTGANKVWIVSERSPELPETVLFPTITRAREIISAGYELSDASKLRRVIDLPEDLDNLDSDVRRQVERFLKYARSLGADTGYVARNRRSWWSVKLRTAAPIVATYMARRPPSFAHNTADARHLNIAHGLYPRAQLTEPILKALVRYLSSSASIHDGRTYAGGLTKFEPREMERLLVPRLEVLQDYAP